MLDQSTMLKTISNMLANQILVLKKYFAAIHDIKPFLVLNKPIYVGFTVLELNKYLMNDFHYNFIKKKRLMLTFCLLIQTVLLMK